MEKYVETITHTVHIYTISIYKWKKQAIFYDDISCFPCNSSDLLTCLVLPMVLPQVCYWCTNGSIVFLDWLGATHYSCVFLLNRPGDVNKPSNTDQTDRQTDLLIQFDPFSLPAAGCMTAWSAFILTDIVRRGMPHLAQVLFIWSVIASSLACLLSWHNSSSLGWLNVYLSDNIITGSAEK